MTPRRNLAATLAAALLVAPGAAAGAPSRVVSVHLCADQLLLRLADRDQIAAVTHLAADPGQSYMAGRAAGLPVTNGLAEQVIALRPDLVLAGAFSARPTVRILRRLGIKVLDLDEPADFAGIRALIRRAASALGQEARGAALVAEMDARLAALRPPASGSRPLAANYQPNGYTMGPGTLEHAVLTAAGLDNLAARLGLGRVGQLALERLIAAAPDIVVFGGAGGATPSLGRRLMTHPAFRRAVAQARIITLPRRLWACGSWFTAEAVTWLAERAGVGS